MSLQPGVYRDVCDEEYRHWPAISQSSLKIIGEQSPAAYLYRREHPKPPSDAMLLGSAVDCLCLEPDTFDARFEVSTGTVWPNATCEECGAPPRTPCLTKKGEPSARCHSGRRDAHVADGKITLTGDIHWRARAISDAVLGHRTAGMLVSTTEHQVSLLWEDEETGIRCKGRLDCASPGRYLADLKTTRAGKGHPSVWGRYAHGLGYHYQAAYYSDGWRILTGEAIPWLWAIVETEPPYHVSVLQADQGWLWAGRDAYRRALRVYGECMETDVWPGYDPQVQIVSLPPWAERAQEDSDE